uniref:Uncharacterized protein n=1 Tax=Timema tahoe TaxID=61484 RepID=A0A7R9P0T5_9NEOP|nr:unnamed protein product [Timema tahoe]
MVGFSHYLTVFVPALVGGLGIFFEHHHKRGFMTCSYTGFSSPSRLCPSSVATHITCAAGSLGTDYPKFTIDPYHRRTTGEKNLAFTSFPRRKQSTSSNYRSNSTPANRPPSVGKECQPVWIEDVKESVQRTLRTLISVLEYIARQLQEVGLIRITVAGSTALFMVSNAIMLYLLRSESFYKNIKKSNNATDKVYTNPTAFRLKCLSSLEDLESFNTGIASAVPSDTIAIKQVF